MSGVLKPLLPGLVDKRPLLAAEAAEAFEAIMDGREEAAAVAAFLVALRMRGETVEEITAAAQAMRARAIPVRAPIDAVDMCGTGGDARGTFNISTCASFVVAALGVAVAKHGNRAVTSRSGAADVLAALGVRLDLGPEALARCLDEVGIAFLFAPNHHPAMRHVAPIRAALGIRTIFNVLGPLTSPAGVRHPLLGVYGHDRVVPLAQVLKALGCDRALVVHGADGLDEITTTGVTHAALLNRGDIKSLEISVEELGLTRAHPSDLVGGSADENAQTLRAILNGQPGPLRDIVCANAAGALFASGRTASLAQGVALAQTAIDDGRAIGKLDALIALSQSLAPGRP
ncbi:MAG TPA: anthranilate phosphoribosyltransferase [Alphaproteobacteria bacterium]|nr:anthranilate phosphoribosyltransferase [Alphaproteobacteria bacterium]